MCALGLVTSACSSSSKQPASSATTVAGNDASAGGTTAASGKTYHLTFLEPAACSNPDVVTIKNGAYAAAKVLNASVNFVCYSGATEAAASEMIQEIQSAIAQHPDGLVVGDNYPSSEDPLIKQAVKGSIPVVLASYGETSWQADGALSFVGENEYQSGVEAGRQMAADGVTVATFTAFPGYSFSDPVERGFDAAMKAAGAKVISTNMSLTANGTQALSATLQSNPNINGIMSVDTGILTSVDQAIQENHDSGKVKVGSLSVSQPGLAAVKNGTVSFLIDPEYYLQGYYSVQILAQYLRYALQPMGMIDTGPLDITKANVDQMINSASLGAR
jgi:simple sugar transport system substrate-binding protein